MNSLLLAVILAFGGTLAAGLFTFVIGLAGAPGALITTAAIGRRVGSPIPAWGVLLTAGGQLVAALAWVAAVYQSVETWVGAGSSVGRFLVWSVALVIANAPIAMAVKDAARESNRNVQHVATTVTAPLTVIASFVFLFTPSLLDRAFGWVPHFGRATTQADASIPSSFIADRDSLSAAFAAFSRVSELTQVPAGQESMTTTPEHDAKVVHALQSGLSAGRAVRPEFLDWLHPGMRQVFYGRYLAGNALYLEGLQKQDVQKQLEGIRLIGEWYNKFWDSNKKDISAKAFPE